MRTSALVFIILPALIYADPCSIQNPTVVPSLMKRRWESTVPSGGDALDDVSLTEGWYSGSVLAITLKPTRGNCGSKSPIWYTTISSTAAYMQYASGPSGALSSFTVEIKTCSGYTMYKLVPVNGASYCFDFQFSTSETIPVYLPPIAEISVSLEFTYVGSTSKPELVFGCSFTPFANETLTYVVVFYANDVPISHTVHVTTDVTGAVIKETTLTQHGVKQGVTLTCSVGVRTSVTSAVGDLVFSEAYFAGLKVNTNSVTMNRGGTFDVEVESTVPFGCSGTREDCRIELIATDKGGSAPQCTASRVIVEGSQRCGDFIEGRKYVDTNWLADRKWNVKKKLRLRHMIEQEQVYELDRSDFELELSILWSDHGFWSEKKISDIKVRVEDANTAWKGKKTGGHCDPHMMTFDGRPYELHFPGRFLAYSHSSLPVRVHVEISACFNDGKSPYCVCGISIVAGQDVFIMYTCGDYKIIDFTRCDEHVLKVDRYDSQYVIYLPTGTKVVASLVQLDSVLWDYDIYPSISDVGNTTGLSGSLDEDCSNDFQIRYGCDVLSEEPGSTDSCSSGTPRSYSFTPDDFSASFELSDHENLFPPYSRKAYNALKPFSSDKQFCECTIQGEDFKANCTPRYYTKCPDETKEFQCLWTSNPFADVNNGTNTTVITEAEARAKCEEVVESSETFKKCQSLNLDEKELSVETCVFDVLATNDLMWADFALDRSNQACLQNIKKNSTLRNQEADLTAQIQAITCPRGCNRHGNCTNGVCECFDDFAGYDCSTNITTPPNIDKISRGRMCDYKGGCDAMYIEGPKFIEDQPYVCRYKATKIKADGSRCCEYTVTKPAEGRSTFEIKCPLPETVTGASQTGNGGSDDGIATEMSVSVAVSGGEYSAEVTGYLYDAACQTYSDNDDSGVSFAVKENHCYIDETCYKNGGRSTSQACYYCDSVKNSLRWTTYVNKTECIVGDSGEDSGTGSVVGAIVGGVAAAAALTGIGAALVKKFIINRLAEAANLQANGGIAFPPSIEGGLGPGKSSFGGF